MTPHRTDSVLFVLRLAEILLESRATEAWAQLRQIGVEEATGVLPRAAIDWRAHAPEQPWQLGPLTLYRRLVEDAGFRLTVIEDNPPMDRLRLGLDGREEELETVLELLRVMGRLGIEVWCYNWMPLVSWSRTSTALVGRGGAETSGFDAAVWDDAPAPGAPVSEELLWETLSWFLERAVPVAEQAGVKLALHPDDPPLSPVRGVGRIIRSLEAYDRVFGLQPSATNGMTMCQGNVALMTDDLPAAIRRFGGAGRIHFVHFRDVRGFRSALSRPLSTKVRRIWRLAFARTATSASTHPSAPTTPRRWRATRRLSPATRCSAACTRSATCRACSQPL